MSTNVNFREVIKEIKRQKRLSNEEIGSLVGASRSGIDRICNRGVIPRWDIGERLISLINQ
ncbi:hypothetical protein AL038_00045 [Beggiatoa leptomitoformis]|uniref:hypothetical protein n=1 Tax=Beggiatoa leptomitoformis TaxID=288004 RepID=UPI000706B917|nr:hypothetical protein [Beggiatoa leptomitoformis]ALG66422.1 hypothetical protein AL038_00045 [Beggiatoa leptomitoformis]